MVNPRPEQEALQNGYFLDLVLGSEDVEAFLSDLAIFSAQSLSYPDAPVFCGITVLRLKKSATAASSDERARVMDELQSAYDGPCLTAMDKLTSVMVPDLLREHRWPEYVEAASHQGLRSILSVPLLVEGDTRAALNLYSERTKAFSDDDVERAEVFASHAAKSLRLALKIAQLSDARNDLAAAMQSRTVIDLAVGAIMAQNSCSQDEAFTILRTASSNRNIKLRHLAESIISAVSSGKVTTHFEE
ncbi:GAF domain-containing protein [Arthrobacter sp. yr096]|uniref:GAF and ANTAR domain-containing protein n=1 Tax=unclassified Arthrobacter TaxID=235627 RepID=UPI00089B2F64|nr:MULTISPECIES: GAF and ANTAR domain-containing protein [unclassified Arthrobacter]SDW03794.1 GAF domain-containing protein [Arthrobacter sp. cf158]SEI77356.1 GAF domain-containing protein [Arthrobacter sp. yr096]